VPDQGDRPKIECVGKDAPTRALSDQITPDQFSLGSGKRRMFSGLPISDSNPHSGGFLSRRQPLAKSAPM
jgi:hypothetical protein